MSLSRRQFVTAGGLALVLSLGRPAHGSTILQMDLTTLTHQTSDVVVAEMVSTRSYWNGDHTRILSEIQVRVHESWKGTHSSGQMTRIVQSGGIVGDMEMTVHGMPRFTLGQRSVLFLAPRNNTDAFVVVGMAQGKRDLVFGQKERRWRVAPAASEGVVFPNAKARREAGAKNWELGAFRAEILRLHAGSEGKDKHPGLRQDGPR